MKLTIDTDVGTDVDDLFALIYALTHPTADINAITTVHGDTKIRAKIVRKLEKMLGKNVPIIAGAEKTLAGDSKYWTGLEPLALTEEDSEPLKEEKLPEYDSSTRLACLGPLTNIALQLETNPSIKNVQRVYIMGSSSASHNFKADLKATEIVFSQPWQIFQVTKQVSEHISFTREELENLRGSELGNFLYESAIRWLDYTRRKKAIMYDVLVVSASLEEDFVRFKEQDRGRFISSHVNTKLKEKILDTLRWTTKR